MTFERLEINRLDANGEVLRRICCLARHVSVFRSKTATESGLYAAVLQGIPTKERFSILLDDRTFDPTKHSFIGFSDRLPYSDLTTVASYMSFVGMPTELTESTLLRFGLGGVATAKVADLNPSQIRILEILAATQYKDRVLVLNDPFQQISQEWREKVAELLTQYAWDKQAIVVITRLSYRPQRWIENEIITRIQLERPRQATIGFGTSTDEPNLQQNIHNEKPTELHSGIVLTPQVQTKAGKEELTLRFFRRKNSVKTVSVISLMLLLGFIIIGPLHFSKESALSAQLPRLEPANPHTLRSDISPQQERTRNKHSVDQASGVVGLEVMPNTKLALDKYPDQVKEAVLGSFDDPEGAMKIWYQSGAAVPGRPVQAPPIEITNTFQIAEDASSSTWNNQQDMEAQREEIRARFLRAIQQQSDEP